MKTGSSQLAAPLRGQVQIWALQSGHDRRLMACERNSLDTVGLSQDGRVALIEDEAAMTMVVDVQTDTALMTIPKQGLAVALHSNGRSVALGNTGDGGVRTVNIGTGQETPLDRVPRLGTLEYSGDGARLAVATSESVRVLDSETGELIAQSADAAGVSRIAIDRTGATLLFRDENRRSPLENCQYQGVRAKDMQAANRKRVCSFLRRESGLCPENGGRHVIRVVDPASDEDRGALVGHGDGISAVTFAVNDRVAITSSRDGTIRFWDLDTLRELLAVPGEANDFSVRNSRLDVIAGSSKQAELLNLERSNHYAALAIAAGDSSGTVPAVVDWSARGRLVEWYALRNECGWAKELAGDLPAGQSAGLAIGRCGERTPGFGLIKAFGAVPDAVSTKYLQLLRDRAPWPCVVTRGVEARSH